MKKFVTILLVLALSIGTSVKSFSQTKDDPWAIGLGLHWASFSNINLPLKDQFKGLKFMGGPVEVSLSRYLTPYFNAQLTTGILILNTGEHPNYTIKSNSYYYFDLDGQIKFLGGLIKEDARFTPYYYFGFGGQHLNEKNDLKAQTGLGVDVKIAGNASLYARADYVFTTDRAGISYIHPHVGIKLRFSTKHDRDKDGIVDEEDRCPDVFGLAALKGCPDKDGDGVADIDDKCPDVFGLVALQGCPDKDGDGVADAEDLCPDVAGLAELKGCPDRDKDGIADKDDNCPDEAGPAKFKGCPDTDGDGIIDKEDACPTVAGTVALKGCPDRDGDGVADKDDKCPDVFGTVANFGCPEVKKFEVSKVVYFNTAQSVVISKYAKDIDDVVAMMKEHSDIGVAVEGYADEQGSEEYNMKLSEKRADYVINYMVKKGIAKDRLTKKFYGKSRPVADNKTAEGRALNRRVEIKTAD